MAIQSSECFGAAVLRLTRRDAVVFRRMAVDTVCFQIQQLYLSKAIKYLKLTIYSCVVLYYRLKNVLLAGLVIPTVTSSKTTAASARCGPNWVERPFSSLCYHFSPTIELYSQAEQNCKNMGGQILSIIAVDEQIFVQSKLT